MKRDNKYIYGKFHHDTFEFKNTLHVLFSDFLKSHKLDMKTHNDVVDLRNKTIALLNSWIGSKKIESKLGIKIPLSTTSTSVDNFLEKQARSISKKYKSCEICGENRVTHYCHIIPRNVGGPNNEKNYIYLCPLHHHLFDNNRLEKKEWDVISFSNKQEASQEYANKIRLLRHQEFWKLKNNQKK